MHPLRPDDVRRRATITPHRVGQNAIPVDLQQRRGVAEPVDRDLARRGFEGSGLWRDQRDFRPGSGGGARTDHLPENVPLFLAVDAELGSRFQVDEDTVLKIR
jgi:hypothetical protein